MPNTSFVKFKSTWEEEIKKIDNYPIDSHGAEEIKYNFRQSRRRLWKDIGEKNYTTEISLELRLIESKLNRAIQTSMQKNKSESRRFWIKLLEKIGGILKSIKR